MKQRSTHNPDLAFIKHEWKGNILNVKNQYVNLDGPSEKSFRQLFQWQIEKNPLKGLKKKQQSPVQVITGNAFVKAKADGFTWLGHASYFFTMTGKNFITDPVLYGLGPIKRYTALPCAVADLSSIDYILLSHNHRDHCDKKSLQQLCAINPQAIILTGLEIGKLLRSWKITNTIIEAGWYQTYPTDNPVKISYLPARHWNRRGLTDMNDMLWGSFMIQSNGATIYFGADSGLGSHFAEIGNMFSNIDYAMLGIGAYKPEWFMAASHTSPADVLIAAQQLKAKYLVPMHYGTFDLSDEPIFYPLQELMQLSADQHINNILPLSIGQKHFI
jgi:L-ascorbate metabolism protein UlaG (beta-lactamase superfamily)